MAINYPGPYEVRFFYSTDTTPGGLLTHQFRYSLLLQADPDPGDPFSAIDIVTNAGGTLALSTQVDAVQNVVEDLYNSTDSTMDYAELWKYTTGTFEASYVSTYNIGDPATSAVATTPAGSSIYTFRSTNGGIMRCTLVDGIFTDQTPKAYADLATVHKDFVDYVLSGACPFKARDNGKPFAFLKAFSGQNEAIFKRRYGR